MRNGPSPTHSRPPVRFLRGVSAQARALDELIDRVSAASNSTVLLTGESGVGKEVVARTIHERSRRRDGPFLGLNCAAVTEGLLEAELFGYEPGAFTGGVAAGRTGLFAQAAGGTLLLDEIGELALPLQAKLLRVLQERSFRRVGGLRDETLTARVIAATNRDLTEMVARGTFRDDLYYRLNVMQLRVAALREHPEDIEPLARQFLRELALESEREGVDFEPEALETMRRHDWPGNVRELRNAVERGLCLCPGTRIDGASLGLEPSGRRPSPSSHERSIDIGDGSLRGVEERLIRRVLADQGGNRSSAARVLGINRATLYHKLKHYGI